MLLQCYVITFNFVPIVIVWYVIYFTMAHKPILRVNIYLLNVVTLKNVLYTRCVVFWPVCSCCSINSFLYSVLLIIVFLFFLSWPPLYCLVHRFTTSDYPFGIFKLFLYIAYTWKTPVIYSSCRNTPVIYAISNNIIASKAKYETN
jgi:hypothetical protein